MKSPKNSYSQVYEKWFREERTAYQESYDSSQKRLDEILLIVTIPTLGWFVVCLKDIGYPATCFMQILLWIIISGFVGVIVCNAISLWASVNANAKMVQNLDDDYGASDNTKDIKDTHGFYGWRKITAGFNYTAYILFVISCVSFACFMISSINAKIQDKKVQQTEVITMERKGNIPLPPSPKPPKK